MAAPLHDATLIEHHHLIAGLNAAHATGHDDDASPLEHRGKLALDGVDVDIAVDPLEGTNLCATGAPGAIAVLAACLVLFGYIAYEQLGRAFETARALFADVG